MVEVVVVVVKFTSGYGILNIPSVRGTDFRLPSNLGFGFRKVTGAGTFGFLFQ